MRRGIAMRFLSASASASATRPARSRRRTSGMAAAPAGLLRSRCSPAQTVSSLSWMRSDGAPPKTMAPSRPLPIGSASFQDAAGCRYQSVSGDAAEADTAANRTSVQYNRVICSTILRGGARPGWGGPGRPRRLWVRLPFLYCLHPGFVGRGTVHAGDGDVVQAQVHAELAPVMHVVVQYEAANDHRLRHGEKHLAALEQRPRLHEAVVVRARQGRPPGRDGLVEFLQQFLVRSRCW